MFYIILCPNSYKAFQVSINIPEEVLCGMKTDIVRLRPGTLNIMRQIYETSERNAHVMIIRALFLYTL